MADPERLLLLTPERAQAAIAWPAVRKLTKSAPGYVQAGGCWYDPAQWMHLAGLGCSAHDDVAPVLFELGFIGPDGTVAGDVIAYARRIVATRLKAK